MRKTVWLLLSAAWVLQSPGSDVQPRHRWDFDRTEWFLPGRAADFGADERKCGMSGWIAAGQGMDASAGLVIDGGHVGNAQGLQLPYDAFTVDMKFKLAEPLDGKHARGLWTYSWNGPGCGSYAVNVVADGRIRVMASRPSGNGGAVDFAAESVSLAIAADKYHSLRVAVARQGSLSAWLDGELVLEKEGAPSLNALYGKASQKSCRPALTLGRGSGESLLNGAVDDVAIYDVALGAPVAMRPPADYSRIAVPEFKPVPDGSDTLVLDVHGRGCTGRFHVLDHEEGAFGEMKSADGKFLSAASSAAVSLDGERMKVKINCPVPSGMAPERHKSEIWRGDYVELFVRPSATVPDFYVYAVNSGGIGVGERFSAPGVKVQGWKSQASLNVEDTHNGFVVSFDIPVKEIFGAPLNGGDTFGINFVRHGATCSGRSMWCVKGGLFNNTFAFGMAAYGGGAAYFARRLAAASERCREVAKAGEEGARAAVAKVFLPLKEAVARHGSDPASFSALESMFARVDRALLHIALGGRSILLFRPENVWGNQLDPEYGTRPLETVRVKCALNARATYAFAAANLTDEWFMGQLKLFDRCRSGFARTRPAVTNGVARHFAVRRGFHIAGRDGRKLYDPIMDLPMKNVLRLGPGEVAPIYLELDTHGLSAGRHYAQLLLRQATPGFADARLAVEVDVVDADLDSVVSDKAGYDAIGDSFRPDGSPCHGMIRYIVSRGYNFVQVTDREANLFPRMDKSGRWRISGYESLDRHIEAFLAAGLPPERMKVWIYLGMHADIQPHAEWAHAPIGGDGKPTQFGSKPWSDGVQFMVHDVSAHLKAKYGVGKDRIYWYPVDEPSGDMDDKSYKSTIARAYRIAKEIKAEDPANLTMTDPLPRFLESEKIFAVMPKLAEVYDVIELYRPAVTEAKRRLVHSVGLKEVWTYHIIDKETPPNIHRRAVWMNLRDGFREISTYWHMTESAGNAFDSADCGAPGLHADYATLYVDWDMDALLTSRRQMAADMAAEEGRLILFLRRKFKTDMARLRQVDAIVKEAADLGTMSAMDAARERLLSLVDVPVADGRRSHESQKKEGEK